jgi:hypothetical protein
MPWLSPDRAARAAPQWAPSATDTKGNPMTGMRAASILTSLLVAAAPLRAEVFAFAKSSDGARVLLYDKAGPCVGGARLAEHINAEGEKTPGCWVLLQATVMVSFLDGERGDIPVAYLMRASDS